MFIAYRSVRCFWSSPVPCSASFSEQFSLGVKLAQRLSRFIYTFLRLRFAVMFVELFRRETELRAKRVSCRRFIKVTMSVALQRKKIYVDSVDVICDVQNRRCANDVEFLLQNFFSKRSFRSNPLKRTKSVTKLERKRTADGDGYVNVKSLFYLWKIWLASPFRAEKCRMRTAWTTRKILKANLSPKDPDRLERRTSSWIDRRWASLAARETDTEIESRQRNRWRILR